MFKKGIFHESHFSIFCAKLYIQFGISSNNEPTIHTNIILTAKIVTELQFDKKLLFHVFLDISI